ncbi:MAG: Myxococcales trans domain protein, partial [Myxococcales bacterium]|nr:Myxococcales trans domain protein [Myxococcales bacterium]
MSRRMRVAVSATGLCIVAATASATVTQVDGTIVPISDVGTPCFAATPPTCGMFNFFKCHGEEPPAVAAPGLDIIGDAAEQPQIFIPNTATPVIFEDLGEGAGFENSFGWYNVGDNVSTAVGRDANLHPVLGCGTAMNATGDATHHKGNTAYYLVNSEETVVTGCGGVGPGTISVDFAQERTAGRYKGGFIAFYLITPEDPANPGNRLPNRRNCGDFKADPASTPANLSLFGRIYFTEKDLNNDGDFVHDLVYKSKATAKGFLFGFEDLFRGGDNDFEDMLIRVQGLTPPCVPQAEVCDGLDNDCDGLIDNMDPDLQGVGTACTCDGIALTCDNGPRQGVCQVGVTACTSGSITCHGTGTPSTEVCDNIDNNCNGVVDDNIPMGAACDGPDADLCKEGFFVCQNGMTVCSDNTGNNVEVCNGIDDNCNGQTDEGNPGGGGTCGSSIGVCTPGTFQCQMGVLNCVGGNQGGPELCNGLDDNCNGVVDDMVVNVGQQCGTTNVGECDYGQTICVSGSLQCAGAIGPSPEKCNGLDDNCNG